MEVIVRTTKFNPWTGITKWDSCFDHIGSYYTRSGSRYTGLTPEEARSLEQRMGMAEHYLDPDSSFWDTYGIKIGSREVIIDTGTPEGELKYKVLRNHKRVAQGIDNITPSTDYVMINREAEAQQLNKASKIKRDAYKAIDKMSIEEMRKCLRLFGVKPDTMSNELVESKLMEHVEADPPKFLRLWVKNPDKEFNFLIEEALAKNIIRKNRTQYFFGTDSIGNGIEDVIAYLKDNKNSDILGAIRAEASVK